MQASAWSGRVGGDDGSSEEPVAGTSVARDQLIRSSQRSASGDAPPPGQLHPCLPFFPSPPAARSWFPTTPPDPFLMRTLRRAPLLSIPIQPITDGRANAGTSSSSVPVLRCSAAIRVTVSSLSAEARPQRSDSLRFDFVCPTEFR